MHRIYLVQKTGVVMSTVNETLGKRLERLRKLKGITAKCMALSIGVPQSTYREWEYGRGLKIPPLKKISQVLAITVTELLTGEVPEVGTILTDLEKIEVELRQVRLKLSSLL